MKLIPYIKAHYPVLYILSSEELRAEQEIVDAVVALNNDTENKVQRAIRIWSVTTGFIDPNGNNPEQIEDPTEALNVIRSTNVKGGIVYIMRDLHAFFSSPKLVRTLRDIARIFKESGSNTLILISPVNKLPPELERDITLLEFDLPKIKELQGVFNTIYTNNVKKKIGNLSEDEIDHIVKASMGMTSIEAENAFAKAIVEHRMDIETNTSTASISRRVLMEKALAVKKTGILEYFECNQTSSDIGGLDNLKKWLTIRNKAFTKKAQDYGLPTPKGILLVGLPGCGKSLTAKAASNILNVPLLKMDIGKIFGGLVGESEKNMRTAIQTAEAVGNCVLWLDEMEKAFAGVGSSNSGDSGTSQRVFGNFITWMQEKTSPCFIIATVNRIQLPPELLRKGRFDEIFFVGLPSNKEREDIIKIHTKHYKRDPEKLFNKTDMQVLVDKSEQFSGAEIEGAIVTALYQAFSEDKELNSDFIIQAMESTMPLARSKSNDLDEMIKWAEAYAINASVVSKDNGKIKLSAGRQLDLH